MAYYVQPTAHFEDRLHYVHSKAALYVVKTSTAKPMYVVIPQFFRSLK